MHVSPKCRLPPISGSVTCNTVNISGLYPHKHLPYGKKLIDFDLTTAQAQDLAGSV